MLARGHVVRVGHPILLCAACPFVVKYVSSGRQDDFNFLVMERLGENLAELRKKTTAVCFVCTSSTRVIHFEVASDRKVHAMYIVLVVYIFMVGRISVLLFHTPTRHRGQFGHREAEEQGMTPNSFHHSNFDAFIHESENGLFFIAHRIAHVMSLTFLIHIP